MSPQVDQLLADEQVSVVTSAGNTLWPLTDNLGTVRDLADRNESTGAVSVTNHRVIDSYGNITSETNAAVDEVFAFTGKYFDDQSGLQNNLNRWYLPSLGQWMGEDPSGLGPGVNPRRYVHNSPTNLTDPTGLLEERLTDARRTELMTKAEEQLRGLMNAGTISRSEARMRWYIVHYALHSPFKFSTGGWRNPEFWTDDVDPEGQYTVRPDRNPGDAIKDAWDTPGYKTGCKKAAQLLQFRGILGFCDQRWLETKNQKYRDWFDKLLGTNVPSDVYDKFVTTETRRFEDTDYLPGDRAWMKNPYWFALPVDDDNPATIDRSNFGGEEGSNVIAIGGGLFVSYNGDYIYDKVGLQKYIRRTFDSVPGSARLNEFQFERRFSPKVPDFGP